MGERTNPHDANAVRAEIGAISSGTWSGKLPQSSHHSSTTPHASDADSTEPWLAELATPTLATVHDRYLDRRSRRCAKR